MSRLWAKHIGFLKIICIKVNVTMDIERGLVMYNEIKLWLQKE